MSRSAVLFARALACVAPALCSLGMTQVIASSTFDSGEQGWGSTTDPSGLSWSPTDGNAGGYLRFDDVAGVTWAVAPSRYLGNWTVLAGQGSVQFDRRIVQSECPRREQFIRIAGPAGDEALWSAGEATPEWTTVSAPIDETAWAVTGDWARLLSNVTTLEILIELVSNTGCAADEISGIDNVLLVRSSEPCATTDYPGTGDDLFLGTGVNKFPTIGPCVDVKVASAGDYVSLWVVSLGGTFDADPPILLAQPFLTGMPPVGLLPGLHVDTQLIVLVNGAVMTPLGWAQVIGPTGSFYSVRVPPGLEGLSVILQGGTFSSNARNGSLALTDAHELQIVAPGG